VHVPIPEAQQHLSDFGRISSFDATIVRIETACGLVGYGEAKEEVGSSGNNHGLTALINHKFGADRLIGEDPRDINRLWEVLYNGVRDHYALRDGHVFPILGRRGITVSAISGIDMALWDLLGKSLGAPVWRLLGGTQGRTHAGLRVGRLGRRGRHRPAADRAMSSAAAFGRQDARRRDRRRGAQFGARVKAAREALGPDIGPDVRRARHLHRGRCQAASAGWSKTATSPGSRSRSPPTTSAAWPRCAPAPSVPIAVGESEFTRFDFLDIAQRGGADFFQPDLAICGGISEAMRIGAIASAYNLRLAPHLWTGALAFAAGLHVTAASPAGYILEYSLGANPLLHELAAREVHRARRHDRNSRPPGLGVTWTEGRANAFVQRLRPYPS
jgi:L-alanine-DL-glutamate epimerase-like enolase superfamily enzyme